MSDLLILHRLFAQIFFKKKKDDWIFVETVGIKGKKCLKSNWGQKWLENEKSTP